MIELTGWRNGNICEMANHVSYGLKISTPDRKRVFPRKQKSVLLELEMPVGPNRHVTVNIDKPSFWNSSCREMINQKIGEWMHKIGVAPWPKGKPPIFNAHQNGGERLIVSCRNQRE